MYMRTSGSMSYIYGNQWNPSIHLYTIQWNMQASPVHPPTSHPMSFEGNFNQKEMGDSEIAWERKI